MHIIKLRFVRAGEHIVRPRKKMLKIKNRLDPKERCALPIEEQECEETSLNNTPKILSTFYSLILVVQKLPKNVPYVL